MFQSLPQFFRPNGHPLPFNDFLNCCSSLNGLKQIHARVLTQGFSQCLPLTTKLIELASFVLPAMEYARRMFDSLPHKDPFAWNTMIRGYAVVGPCREALLLYREMHRSGMSPDNFTFPFVIRPCSVLSALREGKEVHCNTVKNGFGSDIYVQTALVTMYSQNGEISDAESVFGGMFAKNIVSWTAMIAGYAQNGFYRNALGVFRWLVCSGMRPNVITLVSTLPACAGLEFFNSGKLIHGYAIKLGSDSYTTLVNALIAMYGKCGNVDIARSLFDGMSDRNLSSWNAMISAYEHNNASGTAIKLFFRMQTEKIKFDYITMLSVISACTRSGALDVGRWVHGLVKSKGIETNPSIINALLDMYGKCGSIDSARDMFEKLPEKGVVSWSAILGAYAAHGHGEDALKLFARMKEEGVRPNSFTFTSVLAACSHAGLVDEGKKHFDSMTRNYSIVPSVEHCACMVDLLGRAGKLIEAYQFIKRMPVKTDAGVWMALLGACRIHGDLKLAELVAENLFRLDSETVSNYILMSNIYAEAGRWEDAARLRGMMKERDLKKIPGQSLVEINKKSHRFHAG